MTANEFKYIVELKGLSHNSKSVAAAQLVMVNNISQAEAARILGIKTPSVNKTVKILTKYKHGLRVYARVFA